MHCRLLILSLLFAGYSCRKDPALWQTENLNNNQVSAFGHGGMGIFSLYPIDSFESLQQSLDLGADGTEMDLQLSKDNQIFLFHAADLHESTDCEGPLADKNSSEIQCEYNGVVHKGLKVLPFAALFEKLHYSEKHIFTFECKLETRTDSASRSAFAKELVTIITNAGILNRSFIETTNPAFIDDLRRANKDLKIFLYTQQFEVGLDVGKAMKLYGITMDMNRITREEVMQAHEAGLRVTVFNEQTEDDNLKSLQLSPDFIQTDRLKHLLKVLDKR